MPMHMSIADTHACTQVDTHIYAYVHTHLDPYANAHRAVPIARGHHRQRHVIWMYAYVHAHIYAHIYRPRHACICTVHIVTISSNWTQL